MLPDAKPVPDHTPLPTANQLAGRPDPRFGPAPPKVHAGQQRHKKENTALPFISSRLRPRWLRENVRPAQELESWTRNMHESAPISSPIPSIPRLVLIEHSGCPTVTPCHRHTPPTACRSGTQQSYVGMSTGIYRPVDTVIRSQSNSNIRVLPPDTQLQNYTTLASSNH